MPIYEYECQKCGASVELLIRGDERPECTECGSNALQKQLSVPAAHSNSNGSLPVMPAGGGGG